MQVSTEKNPLDDTRTVFLSLSATTGQSRFGDAVWLVVRCQSGKINAFINWNSYLGLEQTPVITRLGAGEAKNQKWPLSTDNKATFYPGDAAAFLEQLFGSRPFRRPDHAYSESPITAVFDLAGLSAAVKPLREVCPAKAIKRGETDAHAILVVLAGLMGGPLAAQANTRWDYGTLTLINIGTMVPVWSAGDTTAVLEWPREKDVIGADTKPRTIPQAASQIRC